MTHEFTPVTKLTEAANREFNDSAAEEQNIEWGVDAEGNHSAILWTVEPTTVRYVLESFEGIETGWVDTSGETFDSQTEALIEAQALANERKRSYRVRVVIFKDTPIVW